MKKLQTVILAAGFGTRMKSNVPKVIHKILDKPLVEHVITAAKDAGSTETCIIVGHKSEEVKNAIASDNVEYRLQKEVLGTGHAVMMAEDFIDDESLVLILFGDTPLITSETIKKMIDFHVKEENSVTVLSTDVDDPTGYGRIIRNEAGRFIKSVEHKDANNDELKVNEINSGMYCFDGAELKYALKNLTNHNAQGEYYLPDTLEILMGIGKKVEAVKTANYKEILGINNRHQLHIATEIMRERINISLMLEGVTIISSETTFISPDASIGKDTIIYPGTIIEGPCKIGENCDIGPNARIIMSCIGDDVKVENSTILDSSIGNNTTVGPYAYIRPNCEIGSHVKIGDFVEVKNATIKDHTKASHLTYIGDADVGSGVNFGCGTVVVNYDGENKHRTVIEDHAFIGCNTNLVSPVNVKERAYTAAGSTITKDVPEESLAIARARQVNVENWVSRNRKK
ncbi:bifunctional UDP-N-acetylglucosamine diphosphorylase/glucosamine-1-phosphate N-acetyltransferase GlmU [Vallitalea okinawensis]|uniref:bifunctional UDP-N-acetylglucosamine diphosphorylase/glucosamine-1-phosphate N-acetyltransferase GlmU n=1 Tax=Vallitalea okinawensis TaxID=2078660 RepID=UPI000CFD93CB|nr:bifunctional UDP-N-acetylglucosamine diphosphorylase/glucosamine-1-phosphate N-acetyltransferase GlmU [Vallitalea okinawensis]